MFLSIINYALFICITVDVSENALFDHGMIINCSNSAGWSDSIKFKTPPAGGADEVKFISFGDMGKAPRDPSLEHYIQVN